MQHYSYALVLVTLVFYVFDITVKLKKEKEMLNFQVKKTLYI